MSLPIVTIIGRPNVGKSTLFNRIIQRRDAIVDDMPGVTRDRKFAETEWAGRSFTLVDTGGYLPSEEKIGKEVFRQVRDAIGEADLVIFMVDAKTGVTALDEEIAQLLNRSARKALLTVNKVDYSALEVNRVEFYKLGLGDPITISAVSGRNIGDFLDLVVDAIPEVKRETAENDEVAISLAVVGRPNVGKSSLVNAFLGENKQIVTEIPGTTRDAIDTVFKYHNQQFLLIDTAGLRKRSKVQDSIEYYSTVRSFSSIQRCEITLLLIDATIGLEMQDKRILQEAIRLNKGIVLVVNKWDLIEKDSNTAREFEIEIQDKLKGVQYLPILFVSALTKQRIFKIIDVAKSVDAERGKKIKTSELNKFLADVTARYSPPSMDQKEVKLNYCSQVNTNPPVFAFFGNAPKSIRANYRSYLENQLRKRFGFFGVTLTLVFRKK